MKLKSLPEDFEVEELADIALAEGPFAVYRLTKRSLGTPEAITAVQRRWKLLRRQISYGGLKDKHAVTRQWVTIHKGPRRDLTQENFSLEYQGQAAQPFGPQEIAGNRFRGLNQWPTDLPGFRDTVLAYMGAMEGLCKRLVPIYAVALDLPPDHFDAMFEKPNMIQRLSHYPPRPSYDENEFSIAPHTDSGFMTLLAPSAVPGLAIRLPDGTWFDAPSIPGCFTVNGGDILRRWTNDRFLSTPHRVLNVSGLNRYAIPFFFDTHPDTLLACLPSCCSADNPPKYEPITYDDYALWYATRNYVHLNTEQA